MPLVIIIAVVAIAIVIAAVVLFNSSTQSVDEIPDIPIAGYSDTSDPEEQIDPIPTLAEPTSVKVTYEVATGEQSWIEIYENGSSEAVFAGIITGPATETYDVTNTLTFEAANPTPVTLTVDGEKVDLTKSPTTGYYTYTVDFNAYLANWRAENDLYAAGTSNTADPSNTAQGSSNNVAATSNTNNNRTTNNSAGTSNTSNSRN